MKLRHGKTNFQKLESFLKTVEDNNGYAKFNAEGFMDLTIEKTWEQDHEGNPVYSICHYGEQNGDLMRDPEMTVGVNWNEGTILPLTFRNDYMGMLLENFVYRHGELYGYRKHWLHDSDNFLSTWLDNIKEQGFTANNFKTLSYEVFN